MANLENRVGGGRKCVSKECGFGCTVILRDNHTVDIWCFTSQGPNFSCFSIIHPHGIPNKHFKTSKTLKKNLVQLNSVTFPANHTNVLYFWNFRSVPFRAVTWGHGSCTVSGLNLTCITISLHTMVRANPQQCNISAVL